MVPSASRQLAIRGSRARVLERHDVHEAIRITAPLAVFVAVASTVLFAGSSPERTWVGAAAVVGLIWIWHLAHGRLRRRPHIAAFGLVTVILVGRLLPLYLGPETAILAEAYFGLVVIGSAVFLPWSARWHGAWLAVAGSAYGVAALTVPAMAETRTHGVAFAVTAISISFAGNALVRTRRRRTLSAESGLRDQRAALREAQSRLKAAAHEDPLTGLSNRRRLNEDIAVLEARRARGISGLSAIMIDLDAFKAYNDTLGHPAGDKVLHAIAVATRGAVRAGDHVYRYGGEEILVLLDDDSGDAALAAAERILRAVRELRLAHPGTSTGSLTVSAGAAASGGRSIGPWDVINEADRALYQAKAAGSGQAVAHEAEAAVHMSDAPGVVARPRYPTITLPLVTRTRGPAVAGLAAEAAPGP